MNRRTSGSPASSGAAAGRRGGVSRHAQAARIVLALALGIAGLVLNIARLPLLSEGTPPFAFGGATALLALLWLGPRLGAAASAISVVSFWVGGGPAIAETLLYVCEVVAVYWLYRRIGSLVAGSLAFWLTAGLVLDRLAYHQVLDAGHSVLVLLLVKQLLNGFLNALVAEAGLWIAPSGSEAAGDTAPSPLQRYVFRRVLFVVLVPIFFVALLYTRAAYQRRVDELQVRQLQTAGEVRMRVETTTRRRNDELVGFARTVESRRAAGYAGLAARTAEFAREHPEFTAVGVTDRAGTILAAVPERTARGEWLVGVSVAARRYFKDAAREMRMSAVPEVLGVDHVGRRAEPALVLAPPLLDAEGRFDGVVYGMVSRAHVREQLSEGLSNPAEVRTLVDSTFAVIESLDPDVAAGGSLRSRLPVSLLEGAATTIFTYTPSAPPREGRAAADGAARGLRYAAYQAVPTSGWGVLVEVPLSSVEAQMVGTAYSVVALLAVTLVLAGLMTVLVARQISRPLAQGSEMAADIAAGRFPGPAPLARLAASRVVEVRSLGANLLTMQQGLIEYRALSAARERESEERFSATFHQAAVGIGHLDLHMRWQRVNQRLCTIVGAEASQLLGQSIADITHPDDREMSRRMFYAMLRPGSPPSEMETRYTHPDGTSAVTHTTLSLVRDESDTPRYFILVMQDIADRRRLEVQLLQAHKMESVGRLAGGVAHDFNNLLTAILGFADMLAARLGQDQRGLELLQQIQEAGERASRLTRQLLAFARRQAIEPQVVDLNELIRGMEDMLRRLIGEDIEFECVLEPDTVSIRADPGQIEQVILNLVINARDAMPDGGRLTLSTGAVPDDGNLQRRLDLAPGSYQRLTVADTGAGIDQEARERIFEPFFTTKPKEKGTGLGLATCYGIVKQSGGAIDVESDPGKGAAFHVYLPVAIDMGFDVPAEAPRTARPGGRETILLVEDEAAVAKMAAHVLRGQGYTVHEASDGEDALRQYEEQNLAPDLLVTDVVMPRMGGGELASRLRGVREGLKVLFISGYSYDGIGRGGELDPGTAYLQKPFTPPGLASAVRAVLDGSPVPRQSQSRALSGGDGWTARGEGESSPSGPSGSQS